MSSVSAGSGVTLVVTSAASVLATVAVLATWARVRYARSFPFFRCRLRPPPRRRRRRRGRARWRLRRTWATWAGDVLLVRSGALRLWLTPLPVGVPREVTVVALERREVRGLGRRPVALRFTLPGGRELEIAVAADSVDQLVGPFLTAALAGLPEARRERGG
jgi:hypothetical protein